MKVRKSSFSMKLYSWFYGVDQEDLIKENNYCPVFWKVVIAYILCIPCGIFSIPIIFIETFFGEKDTNNHIGERIGLSVAIYIAGFLAFAMGCSILSFFITFKKNSFLFESVIAGFLLWIIAIPIGIYQGIKTWFLYMKDKKRRAHWESLSTDEQGKIIYSEPPPNLIVGFFKAWYNKYCPKIEWVD